MPNNDPQTSAIEQLSGLGFTQAESAIYVHLLRSGVSTGYAIAQALGKPVANVYKSIESLANKGAVELKAGRGRQCLAVPWKQLLQDHQQRFESNLAKLSASLSELPETRDDETVMQLENFDRVVAESKRIIAECETVLLADMEPAALALFKEDLICAAKRGIEVRIKIYEPEELPGVHVTLRVDGAQVYQRCPDVAMDLCADGVESLIALFDLAMNRVLQAFRSRSSLMNMQIYCGQLYELILTDLKPLLASDDLEGAKRVLANTDHLHPFSADGPTLQRYIDRYQR